MRIGMHIQDNGLLAALRRFPDEVSKEVRLEMLKELRTVVSDAKLHHRFDTKSGNLERSVRSEVSQSGLSGRVYLDNGIAPYAAPVHNGSKPHKISTKSRKSMYWVSGGDKHFARSVMHPGTKPDTFLYKAFERNAQHIAEQMSKAIDKAKRIAGIK